MTHPSERLQFKGTQMPKTGSGKQSWGGHTWEVSFTSGYILRSTMWLMLDDLPFSWWGSALRSPTQMTFVYPPAAAFTVTNSGHKQW